MKVLDMEVPGITVSPTYKAAILDVGQDKPLLQKNVMVPEGKARLCKRTILTPYPNVRRIRSSNSQDGIIR